MIVTHRIIKCDEDSFIAKGDNNNIEDEDVGIDKIYGVVVFHSKVIGYFILYLLKPLVLIYVIYFIISELLNLRYIRNSSDDNKNSCEEEVKCTDLEKKEY